MKDPTKRLRAQLCKRNAQWNTYLEKRVRTSYSSHHSPAHPGMGIFRGTLWGLRTVGSVYGSQLQVLPGDIIKTRLVYSVEVIQPQ